VVEEPVAEVMEPAVVEARAPEPAEPGLAPPVERSSTPIRPSATRRPSVGKLYDEKPKSGAGKVIAVLLVLALLGGGGAYWYLMLRPAGWKYPWAPPGHAAAPARPADTTAAVTPPPVDSSTRAFDASADTLNAAIRGFGDRALRFGGKPSDCVALDSGLVTLEDAWIGYNLRQKGVAALDAGRAGRDQQLAAGADSSEATFERSGCARP